MAHTLSANASHHNHHTRLSTAESIDGRRSAHVVAAESHHVTNLLFVGLRAEEVREIEAAGRVGQLPDLHWEQGSMSHVGRQRLCKRQHDGIHLRREADEDAQHWRVTSAAEALAIRLMGRQHESQNHSTRSD